MPKAVFLQIYLILQHFFLRIQKNMKKQKKTNQGLQHFRKVALSPLAQAQLRGGCGCGPDSGGVTPPPPPPAAMARQTGATTVFWAWGG
ncbi:hypothetical protein M23134_06948 [Microscilla marina ATCC 23134]|uniref:Uncharacterized protein n=2 Tax=Microscilla marina TaxID=1027 RepID=A1ZYG1_MICM2|nr:hypothetical protein M23134_06948 [Microscilla marina ATCC 23134]